MADRLKEIKEARDESRMSDHWMEVHGIVRAIGAIYHMADHGTYLDRSS